MRKTCTSLLFLCCFLAFGLAATAKDKEPNPADFPTQFRVSNTSTVGSFMIGNFCTMALTDPDSPGLILVVQKHGYGKCHVWDAGTVIPGRRIKKEIELLVKDDKGKPVVEHWSIGATATSGAANVQR